MPRIGVWPLTGAAEGVARGFVGAGEDVSDYAADRVGRPWQCDGNFERKPWPDDRAPGVFTGGCMVARWVVVCLWRSAGLEDEPARWRAIAY